MGHTPYGYTIKNGKAVINEEQSEQIKRLYKNYLSGMSLKKAAAEAGMETYHCSAKRLMQNKHYLGDNFYPAIIDKDTFDKASAEFLRRAILLGRLHRKAKVKPSSAPTSFTMAKIVKQYKDPKLQAEYLYSLIESEVYEWQLS
ncbi:hypothetical protein [Selenomonas bovis]|uniref:hypothetical protein n=1 Tax=Selenomonas bovis TaxID=416586 RepID=UPI00037199B6|nr:hypothetical protein [Selenomonas bovis]